MAVKRYAATPIQKALEEAKKLTSNENISEVDTIDLLEKCKLILYRDIQKLVATSMERKLQSRESESLVSYTRLLKQLVNDEEKQANENKS